MYNLITLRWKKKKKKKEREENMNRWTLVCCEGKMRKGKSDKSNHISLSKKFHLFYTKKLSFSILRHYFYKILTSIYLLYTLFY